MSDKRPIHLRVRSSHDFAIGADAFLERRAQILTDVEFVAQLIDLFTLSNCVRLSRVQINIQLTLIMEAVGFSKLCPIWILLGYPSQAAYDARLVPYDTTTATGSELDDIASELYGLTR